MGSPANSLRKALIRYQRAHGLPETGKVDANIPLESVFPVYTFYTIQEGDLKFVGDSPDQAGRAGKEEVSALSVAAGISVRALSLRAGVSRQDQ